MSRAGCQQTTTGLHSTPWHRAKENGFLNQHFPFSNHIGHASQKHSCLLASGFRVLSLPSSEKDVQEAREGNQGTQDHLKQASATLYMATARSKLGYALVTKRSTSSLHGFSRLQGGFAALLAFQNHRELWVVPSARHG